jgi:hypothetical protein
VTNKRFYVYAIYVDEVVRYIGKGSNGRMYFHVIEAQRINGRRARGAKTDQTSTILQEVGGSNEARRGHQCPSENILNPLNRL